MLSTAGCQGLSQLRQRKIQDGPGIVRVKTADLTDQGLTDIKLVNDRIFIQMNGEQIANRAAFVAGGFKDRSNLTGVVKTSPKMPRSRTDSTTPTYKRTIAFEATRTGPAIGTYLLAREYAFDGRPFQITWRVTLPAGEQFALLDLTFLNRDSTPIELDQDEGDTHDGIQILTNIGLLGRAGDDSAYRFALPGVGARQFTNQPIWKTFPASRYVTIFDDDVGVTYGIIQGATSPKMVIIDGDRVDVLVNETMLDAAESVSYRLCVAFHRGGQTAPETGRRLYQQARRWTPG